jgi:hypothetical protein
MKFSAKIVYKKFDKRILIYGISLILIISAVMIVKPDLLQSSFKIGGETSKLYLKGILYNNQYFTSVSSVTAYNNKAETSFADNKILFDPDGKLNVSTVPATTGAFVTALPAEDLIGKLPLTIVTLSDPYHVDVNGDQIYLADLATRIYTNADGKKVYQFDYITTLTFTEDPEISAMRAYYAVLNGLKERLDLVCEWGHYEYIQAMIGLDLPSVAGVTYAFDASIKDYRLSFHWTGPEAQKDFGISDVKSFLDTNYPPADDAIYEEIRTFIYNNEGIQPSASVNQPLPIDVVNGVKVVRVGLDKLYIPSVYKCTIEGAWPFGSYSSPHWYFMIPTIEYDIQLKIMITDIGGVLDYKGNNNTYTGNPPTPWWPIFPGTSADVSLSIMIILIGGGAFIILLAYMKRKQSMAGGYY